MAWFSCGDASAVAAKLALQVYGHERVSIVRIRLEGEHPDNDRFAADCIRWFNHPVEEIGSHRYASHWEVIDGERFINGAEGAKCTHILKRAVRENYQQFDDIQVFGFVAEEHQRAQDFREHHGEVMVATPLIDEGLSKNDCHALIAAAGIELPVMYRLGYSNNNCVGCVKGGMGYWNKIRVDFPEAFDRMAKLERKLGRSCIGGGGRARASIWMNLTPSAVACRPSPRWNAGSPASRQRVS